MQFDVHEYAPELSAEGSPFQQVKDNPSMKLDHPEPDTTTTLYLLDS